MAPAIGESSGPSDETLTVEEYIQAGLPAPDRDWSGDDMVNAERVLRALSQKSDSQLPRYQSKRSGSVFARMTSPENLGLLMNKDLPLAVRMAQATNYSQSYNGFLKLHLHACLKDRLRDSELVELMGAQFRLLVVMLELLDQFLPTLDKDDPAYQTRIQALEAIKGSLATIVAGGLQALTERAIYRGTELARLVGYMRETFPLIVPRLSPGARLETTVRLESLQKDPAMKDLHEELGELLRETKQAIADAAGP
jgi:hypothetical protein